MDKKFLTLQECENQIFKKTPMEKVDITKRTMFNDVLLEDIFKLKIEPLDYNDSDNRLIINTFVMSAFHTANTLNDDSLLENKVAVKLVPPTFSDFDKYNSVDKLFEIYSEQGKKLFEINKSVFDPSTPFV